MAGYTKMAAEEDWVDIIGNAIHVACIRVDRLGKQEEYVNDHQFVKVMTDFKSLADHLMDLIRQKEKLKEFRAD